MSFDEDLADQIGDLQRKFGNKTVTGETGIMKKTSRQSGREFYSLIFDRMKSNNV